MAPLGGSQAQRDVFWMMLNDAAARGSDPRLAVSLLAERTALKPHSAWGWERYADSLVATGQGGRAEAARQTARGLAGGWVGVGEGVPTCGRLVKLLNLLHIRKTGVWEPVWVGWVVRTHYHWFNVEKGGFGEPRLRVEGD